MACPCCQPPCCTCTGPFYFYVNGKLLGGADKDILLNAPSYGRRDIPGIAPAGVGDRSGEFANGGFMANTGKASDVQCDGDGNIFARITIWQGAQLYIDSYPFEYVMGAIWEARYYKFTLPPGGCGIITGEWIAFPDEANIEEYWTVDGNTLRKFLELDDGLNTDNPSLIDGSPLHIEWGDASVLASCNILCSGTGTGNGVPLEPASCEGVLDCQGSDCECQQLPSSSFNEDSPPGSYDIFGVANFHCLLNPLP